MAQRELHFEMVKEGFVLEIEEVGSLVVVEHHSKRKERDEGHWGVFGKVVKTRALGTKGDANGSTMFGYRVVAFVESKVVVPIVVRIVVLSPHWQWKLVEIGHGVKSVVVNGITTWVGTSSLIR
ncbi:hypothetical protein Tco_0286540, partial [Tanacetum coccineum]